MSIAYVQGLADGDAEFSEFCRGICDEYRERVVRSDPRTFEGPASLQQDPPK